MTNKEKWEKIFDTVVNGKLKNCFSKNDDILAILYQNIKRGKKSIGRREIWMDTQNNKQVRQNDVATAIRECLFDLRNYEMPNKLGHMKYQKNMLTVITRCMLEL